VLSEQQVLKDQLVQLALLALMEQTVPMAQRDLLVPRVLRAFRELLDQLVLLVQMAQQVLKDLLALKAFRVFKVSRVRLDLLVRRVAQGHKV
jgi:hypothetical protein